VDVTTRVETERALRKSEERLRLAAIASGIGYWSWNIDSEVGEIDQRTAEIFGVSKDAPVSAVLARILTEDRERVQNEVQASLEGKGPFRCEFRVGGDGSTCRWVFGLGDISLDANGKAVNFMGISMDISERKRIEDERHRFVSLVENSTEFVGMYDLKGMPSYFNQAGLRMVGLNSLEEALLIPVEEYVL
jgi:PAS domain S-box-containing protein